MVHHIEVLFQIDTKFSIFVPNSSNSISMYLQGNISMQIFIVTLRLPVIMDASLNVFDFPRVFDFLGRINLPNGFQFCRNRCTSK